MPLALSSPDRKPVSPAFSDQVPQLYQRMFVWGESSEPFYLCVNQCVEVKRRGVLINKAILWAQHSNQRRFSEPLNNKKTHGFGCYHSRRDSGWGCHLVCADCWVITSVGLLLLLLQAPSSAPLQLPLLPACHFKGTIPPVIHRHLLANSSFGFPVWGFLQFCGFSDL